MRFLFVPIFAYTVQWASILEANAPSTEYSTLMQCNVDVLGSRQTEDDGDEHERLPHNFEVEIYISVFKTVVIVISAQIQA